MAAATVTFFHSKYTVNKNLVYNLLKYFLTIQTEYIIHENIFTMTDKESILFTGVCEVCEVCKLSFKRNKVMSTRIKDMLND